MRRAHPTMRVLILTVYENQEYVLRAAKLGASSYLVKNVSSQDLSDAIRRIHHGELMFPSDLRHLIEAQSDDEHDPAAAEDGTRELSRRQREVLSLIAEGLSSSEIATRLSLSQRTIETHRRHISHRLQIHTVVGLTKYAIAAGLTRLD